VTPRTALEAADELEAFAGFYGAQAARCFYGDHVCLAAQPDDANGSVEDLVERGVGDTAAITGAWADAIAEAVHDRTTPGSVLTVLGGLELDLTPFARIVERELVQGAMLGALDSEWERTHDEELAPARFAEHVPGTITVRFAAAAEGAFSSLPYADAVRIFNEKQVLPKAAFDALEKGARRTAFTVARMASADMLNTTKDELARVLNESRRKSFQQPDGTWVNPGPNLRDFRRFAKERLESAGWTPANKSHVETIYRTNVVGGYASGRFVEQRKPEVLALLPYWQIRGVNDSRARPTHKAAFGIVLPADSPFWLHAYPPFGYNCRCRVISRSKRWVEREGVRIGPVPQHLPDPGFDSGTSRLISVPASALVTPRPAPPPAPAPTHAPHLHPPLPPPLPAPPPLPGPPLPPISSGEDEERRRRREERDRELERDRALNEEHERKTEQLAKLAARTSFNPIVAKAKGAKSALAQPNTRARGMVRNQVETSLDVKLPRAAKARKKRTKLTVKSDEALRLEAGGGTRAYHDLRTGEVVVKGSIRDGAARALEYFDRGLFSDPRLKTSTLERGDAFLERFAEGSARGVSPDPAGALNDLRTLFHEELHGYSRVGPRVYTGIGRVIEEVGTELNARHIVKNLTPEIAGNPFLAKRFGSMAPVGGASYQTEIDIVCDVVARHAGVTREAAGELVRAAHIKGLCSGGASTSGPLEHLHDWVAALDVTPERAQLIELELQQAHAAFLRFER
jgi:SPP1 gp7 family putative phage head morphogenesis protein